MSIMSSLYESTFVMEHNPNCPHAVLLRLVGKSSGGIDLLPPDVTKDILGYGRTFEEAAEDALKKSDRQRCGKEHPYICGALTDLPEDMKLPVKRLYEQLADVCELALGLRAFVPHEHYDPIEHGDFTPTQVDEAERHQLRTMTSLLVVVAVIPTWGGGIEVEMANRYGVPVIILKPKEKRISRLLLGNAAIKAVHEFRDYQEAPEVLRAGIEQYLGR
jgi:hypothetical protein